MAKVTLVIEDGADNAVGFRWDFAPEIDMQQPVTEQTPAQAIACHLANCLADLMEASA